MNVLFLCPDYFGIYKVIEKGIQDTMNCQLKSVIFEDYQYKSKSEKLLNFFSKLFFKKNLKKIWASKYRVSTIAETERFDYVFVICPDFLINEDLKYITDKTENAIVYFWDSFDNIPRYERTLPYFKSKFSFEPNDVEKYNLSLLTNFYYNNNKTSKTTFDVYFIGTYDSRFPLIKKINTVLKEKNRSSKIIIQTDSKSVVEENKNEQINFIEKAIPVEESELIFREARILLDVQKKIQKGLTFRVFEAIGQNKKLITTNTDIVNYDFYNPNNIFVWTEDTTTIPDAFFEKPYEELAQEIYYKYSLENWIKTIFNLNN